jgi:2-polyprenyl-6-methoxyphenol hydroxylase-like FAD-dependent oxidoreductase
MLASCFEGLAAVAADDRDSELAAALLGGADGLRSRIDASLGPFEQQLHDRTLGRVLAMLPEDDLRSRWDEGRATEPEQMLAEPGSG